jgi:diguanylate cyclase (GGDEF)-like protein
MTAVLLAAAAGIVAGWLGHAVLARRALHAARQDPVTGLPARDAWTRQARRILRSGTHTVALADLDRLKDVNDTYGHAAGDHVLAVTAARMRAWAARCGGAACGRLGGDEFAIITRRPLTAAEAAALTAALAFPVTLPGGAGTIPVSASVGTAPCASRRGLSAALAAADAAMYAAKPGRPRPAVSRPPSAAGQPEAAPARRTRHHGPATAACAGPGRPAG